MDSLGKLLRSLREKKNFGIKKVAAELGVNYSYLSKIENDHKIPSQELLLKLCEMYDADSDQIIALLGQIPSDIREIIKEHGKEVFDTVRKQYSSFKQSKGILDDQ